METFADVTALQAGWRTLDADEISVAETHLVRASAWLTRRLDDCGIEIDTSDEVQAINLETVTCNMVRRIMDTPGGGLSTITQGIGATTASVTISNPDMSLYLSKSDMIALGITGRNRYRSIQAHTWFDDYRNPNCCKVRFV